MLLGYTRVSKVDGSQVLDPQKDALLAAGVAAGHVYEDRASGRREDRPGLAACLKGLREGDTLVLWKLDRLSRDLRHLVNTVHDLTAQGSGSRSSTDRGRPSIRPPQPASWSSGSSRRWRSSHAS